MRYTVKYKNSNTFIIILCIVNFALFLFSFSQKNLFESVETKDLVVRGKEGIIHLGKNNNDHLTVEMTDAQGKRQIAITKDAVKIYNSQDKAMVAIAMQDKDTATITLNDAQEREKLSLQVGNRDGLFIKNDKNNVVGTFTVLEDGGCGLGLADHNGSASSIMRGGEAPGLSFYHYSTNPIATFGIVERIPHFLVMGQEGEEGILIHGGVPTSVMLMDEKGALKLLLSKHGIFKGSEDKNQKAPPKKEKFFTYQRDLQRLFPDIEKSIR